MVKANIQRANELIREGETHLAIQLLEQACAFDPRPNELVKLAKLLVRNPMWDNRALKYLRQAIEVDSSTGAATVTPSANESLSNEP